MNQRQLFLRHVAQTSFSPLGLSISKAENIYLYDQEGKEYIDLISGIGVSGLGHRPKPVQEAIESQLNKYWHTLVYGEYILSPQVQLATLLAEQLPEHLNSTYFVNSGSEATEGAMKLAKRVTGRPEIISCTRAYHGSTQGSASLMSPTEFTQPYHPLLPGIRHIDFNCSYCLNKISGQTAAVIVETVQAEWGVRKPSQGFLSDLRQRCTEMGALLIFDEIQVGYGRTGSLFAFQQYEVEPDILLLAKGMGGGMPIGAFISGKDKMDHFAFNPPLGHISTFGGHPVSCAAGLATLQTLLETNHIKQVKEKEQRFLQRLRHPKIKDIRSAGLLMAVELKDFDQVQKAIQYCLANGLITDWFLFNERSLRIAPPLIITMDQIDEACDILVQAIDQV